MNEVKLGWKAFLDLDNYLMTLKNEEGFYGNQYSKGEGGKMGIKCGDTLFLKDNYSEL